MIHSDRQAFVADEFFPAEGGAGFERNAFFAARGQHGIAVGFVLLEEQFPGRHGNHADLFAGLAEFGSRIEREVQFGTRADQQIFEAGTTFGWEKFIGDEGLAIGLDHFGSSGPYKVLAEKFGFTVPAVIEKMKAHFKF